MSRYGSIKYLQTCYKDYFWAQYSAVWYPHLIMATLKGLPYNQQLWIHGVRGGRVDGVLAAGAGGGGGGAAARAAREAQRLRHQLQEPPQEEGKQVRFVDWIQGWAKRRTQVSRIWPCFCLPLLPGFACCIHALKAGLVTLFSS